MSMLPLSLSTIHRIVALPLLAVVVIAMLTGTPNADQDVGCGLSPAMQDPALRKAFAEFERTQSSGARKICATYKNSR
jgi:hypothetical protein